MNAKTASQVINDILTTGEYQGDPHDSTALKIGKEALERLEEARAWSPLFGKPLLPSETEY